MSITTFKIRAWSRAFLADLKRAWKSWTINWHLLALSVGYFNDNVAQVLPFLKQYLADENVGVVLMLMGIVGLALRFKTTKPLAEK